MSAQVYTPKQIATALGVSESSVKRWVDNGRLSAARTAGGHRKVSLSSISQFVRETGHELSRPEVLGMVATSQRGTLESSQEPLFRSLTEGRETECRELLLSFYLQGESIADLGDRLIGPAFQRVGDCWAEGKVHVYQERRSCEIMMAILHELRRMLPPPPAAAPRAIVATPLIDFSETPIKLVELVLASIGWEVLTAGSGLPLEEIRAFTFKTRPQLVCLSVTHIENAEAFVPIYNKLLVDPTRESIGADLANNGIRHVIGGAALEPVAERLKCDLYASSLASLVSYQATLHQEER
jgi:excisionase family DNA binding protein